MCSPSQMQIACWCEEHCNNDTPKALLDSRNNFLTANLVVSVLTIEDFVKTKFIIEIECIDWLE